jgi:hypothetical protein
VLVLDALRVLIKSGEVTEAFVREVFSSACAELGHVHNGRCVLRGNAFRWIVAKKADGN